VIVVGHVGGVPVEELIPTVAGAGSALLLARAWLTLRLRRRWEPRIATPVGHETDRECFRHDARVPGALGALGPHGPQAAARSGAPRRTTGGGAGRANSGGAIAR
jgi:hypothetical protein